MRYRSKLIKDASWTFIALVVLFFFLFISSPVMAVDTASMSGTIYKADGVTPIDQPAITNIYQGDPCGRWNWVAGTEVDPATGTFTITNVPAGQYYMRVENKYLDPSSTNVVARWWEHSGGSVECSEAELISLSEGQELTGLTMTTWEGASVTGTVYESDGITPIHGQWGVNASRKSDHQWMGGSEIAPDGTYHIRGLLPGEYYIQAQPSTGHVHMYYNHVSNSNDATPLTVAGTETITGIDFQLEMGAAVSGNLYKADEITPFDQPVNMDIFQGDPCGSWDWVAGTGVDPVTGAFAISGVPSGQFYIRVQNSDTTNAVQRWWTSSGGSVECSEAELISLSEGQELTGLTMTTQVGATISGTVYQNDGITPVQSDWGIAAFLASNHHFVSGSPIGADGTYTIKGVPPGDFLIRTEPSINHGAGVYYDNTPYFEQRSTITISGSENITGIDFTLEYPIFIETLNLRMPDDSFNSLFGIFFFYFEQFDLQRVVSITMTDPSGNSYYYTREDGDSNDFAITEQFTGFSLTIPGTQPKIGNYLFTVVTDDFSTTVTHTRTGNTTLPSMKLSTMSPADNSIITSGMPVFTWEPVENSPVPIYYRFKIYDTTGYRVFASKPTADMLSITMQEGLLQPGQTYTWRADIYDNPDLNKAEKNSARSQSFTFTMADTLTTRQASPPAINLDGWGAVSWRSKYYDATSMSVTVIDHDGIAHDGSSHQVEVTFDGQTKSLFHSKSVSAYEADYEYWDGNTPAPGGDYIFSVTDLDGNKATITDTLSLNPLVIADYTATEIITGGTSPTFTWAPVPGAVRYRIRIFDLNRNTLWSAYPITKTPNSYTLPPGILEPDTDYKYRVDAYDSHSPLVVNNGAAFDMLPFNAGDESVHPYIEIENGHAPATWTNSALGTFLIFRPKIHDAQGVPGNIQSVTVTFPDGTRLPLNFDENESFTCGIYYNENYTRPIAPGDYTITVTDVDGTTFSRTETLDVNPIGYPSDASIKAAVNGTRVDLSWEPVAGAAFYRVEIYDMAYNRIHAFPTRETSYTIPAGYLKKDTFYRYRITTRREFFDQGVDNGSASGLTCPMRSFTTTPVPGSAAPVIDPGGRGVRVVQTTDPTGNRSAYWLEFDVSVTDTDGVPENIASVRVTYPDGITTKDLWLNSSLNTGATLGGYGFYEKYSSVQDIQTGVYTFAVQDHAGRSAVTLDSLENIIPDQAPADSYPTQIHQECKSADIPAVSYGVLASDVSGGLAPATVQFTAFMADGTAPFTYDYDFGDGTTKSGAGKKETHTYQQPGTYTAQVTVTDAGGAMFVLQKEILVSDAASVKALTGALQTDADQMAEAKDSGTITFLLNDAAGIIEKTLEAVTNADDAFKTDTRESIRTKVEALVANTTGIVKTLVDTGSFLSTPSSNRSITATGLSGIASGLKGVVSNMVKKGVPVTGGTLTDLTDISGTIYTRTLDTLLQAENLSPARLAELKTDTTAAQAFFRNKPYLLDDIAGGTGIQVDSSRAFDPDQVDSRAAMQQLTEQQTGLLYNALEPTLDIGLQISSSPGVVTKTIAEMVETLFNTYSGKTVTQTDVDEITRNVLVSFSDGTFLAFAVKSVNVVKDYIPRGLFDLPNGNRLGVTDEFAMEFTAYPAFPHAVAAEIIKLGITPSLSRAGGLELQLDQLLSLSVKPGWEYRKSNTFDSLTASFRVTGGTNPAAEAYSLLATYDTGYSQLLPPSITAMDELAHMLDRMAPGGYSIDTRSGVLTLGGLKLKPDYVFTRTSTIDTSAIEKAGGFTYNKLAFAFRDVNGDGLVDIVLHCTSPMGHQVLYSVK